MSRDESLGLTLAHVRGRVVRRRVTCNRDSIIRLVGSCSQRDQAHPVHP